MLENSVPDWTTAGVVNNDPISYQRTPLRLADAVAWPVFVTPMVWVVHSRPFTKLADVRRSSPPSSLPFADPRFPRCRTVIGTAVADTGMAMFAEMVGVPPGFDTRRSISVPSEALSTPMKNPVAIVASSLSTPCGAKGPAPVEEPVRLWNAVTAIVAKSITDVLRTTYPEVPM